MDYLKEIYEVLCEIEAFCGDHKKHKKTEGLTDKVFKFEFIKHGEYLGILNLTELCQELNRDLTDIENILRKQLNLPHMRSEYKSKKIICFKNLTKSKRELANQLLNNYINDFVKCKRCQNIYTELTINKITCKACGFVYDV